MQMRSTPFRSASEQCQLRFEPIRKNENENENERAEIERARTRRSRKGIEMTDDLYLACSSSFVLALKRIRDLSTRLSSISFFSSLLSLSRWSLLDNIEQSDSSARLDPPSSPFEMVISLSASQRGPLKSSIKLH